MGPTSARPTIPVIDLADDDATVAAALRRACCDTGFFMLSPSSHGIAPDLIDAMFDQTRALFSLPLVDKLVLLKDKNNRGYLPLLQESLDPSQQGDTKEAYYIGPEVPLDSPLAGLPLHGPNLWPPAELLPAFRATAEAYYAAAFGLGHRLMGLLALSLGLPQDHFDAAFNPSMAFLRPLRYSAEVSRPADGVLGAGAHTDYGVLTILATDGTPGLQVHLGDEWVDIDVPRHAYMCNVGNMLEHWTNGLYKSPLHRVVSSAGRERYSVPFFYNCGFNTVVECLPCCVSPERPARYEPTTVGRHLLRKYAVTHADATVAIAALGKSRDADAGKGSGAPSSAA